MRLAWAVIALFCARFAVEAWIWPAHDGDLPWQQWLGNYVIAHHHIPDRLGAETFTAAGSSWLPQEWAFSVAVAKTLPFGHFSWLAGAATAAAVLALFLTALRSYRRGASTFALAVTTAFTGFAIMQSFGVRPQVFGWPLLALVLLLLDVEGPWVFVIIPLIALWANLHASALAAPAFVGAWALGTAIEDRAWTPRVERNFVVTVGAIFAVFLTPFQWHLPQYAMSLETGTIRTFIQEWQPTDLGVAAMSAGVLPLLAICTYFGIAAPRERWRDGMLFAVAAVLAFTALRHLAICALVIAPMAAQRLTAGLPQHARVNVILRERFSEALVFAATAVAVAAICVDLVHAPAIAGVPLPRAAIAQLARVPGEHRLYCGDFAWCGSALQTRNVRTFIDGRCDPFPQRVWSEYDGIVKVRPGWSATLDRYRVDAMLVKSGRALAQALVLRPNWHVIYRDRRFLLFLRERVQTAQR